jgi:hypothetical protein
MGERRNEIFAPSLDGPGADDVDLGRPPDDEPAASNRVLVTAIALVALLAVGGGLFLGLQRQPEAIEIAAPAAPYKQRPPEAAAAPPPDLAVYAATEPERAPPAQDAEPLDLRPPPAAATVAKPPAKAAAAAASPAPTVFRASGPFLAQLVAVRSDAAAAEAFKKATQRHGDLFAGARLDIQRADLGAQGEFYRVRAGYFADRAAAVSFCERARASGLDCIAVAK